MPLALFGPELTLMPLAEEIAGRIWRILLFRETSVSSLTQRVLSDTMKPLSYPAKSFLINNISFGMADCHLTRRRGGNQMQIIITFMAVVAGLVFSVAVALLVEELIFGQV